VRYTDSVTILRGLIALGALAALAACDGYYVVRGTVRGTACAGGTPLPLAGAEVFFVVYGDRPDERVAAGPDGTFRVGFVGPPGRVLKIELKVARYGCRTASFPVDARQGSAGPTVVDLVLDCPCPAPSS
jgi:hypothetical protein